MIHYGLSKAIVQADTSVGGRACTALAGEGAPGILSSWRSGLPVTDSSSTAVEREPINQSMVRPLVRM